MAATGAQNGGHANSILSLFLTPNQCLFPCWDLLLKRLIPGGCQALFMRQITSAGMWTTVDLVRTASGLREERRNGVAFLSSNLTLPSREG